MQIISLFYLHKSRHNDNNNKQQTESATVFIYLRNFPFSAFCWYSFYCHVSTSVEFLTPTTFQLTASKWKH